MATTSPTIDLSGNPARHRRERFFKSLFFTAGLLSIVISIAIILSLAEEAWAFIKGLIDEGELSSLWNVGWFPRRGLYDIRTIVVGTFIIAVIGILVALPLGLGAAIYLAEYANPRARRILKPIIEILAGIPSVVLGFWALTFISPQIVQRIWENAGVFSMMAAGIGVGVLIVPLVASVSEDAMRAVP
ncbi:MAG: phosphate ABC transporter permease subunit PstC, partial [Actinomycetota bacterium]